MNNLALWSRPVWDVEPWDRWLRDFFGPAATTDWYRPVAGDFTPAAWRRRGGPFGTARH